MHSRLSSIAEEDVNLDELAQVIRETGRPVPITVLTRVAVRVLLEDRAKERCYVPGAQYTQGETIRFNGQLSIVKSVRLGNNPRQGHFKVLTLALPDGTEQYMVAEVDGAPYQDRETVSDQHVRTIADGEKGLSVRTVVQEAMSEDSRFVWFQDVQRDQWCLTEMLPEVGDEELTKVANVLVKGLENGEPVSKTTEELVQAVWGAGDDGSNVYALRAFALGRTLSSCDDVESLGEQWLWAETWATFTERDPLTVPRMPAGDGITADESLVNEFEDELEKEESSVAKDTSVEKDINLEDIEAWRDNRPKTAVFTLSARHYYEGWLPLTKRVERLFPPLADGKLEVIFHYHFKTGRGVFRAWIDQEQRRVWVSKEMYETFQHHSIYPGARLIMSYRTRREYDIATRPTTKTEPVQVWRMWMENGEIQYSEDSEPRQYDIDDDVFVADVRFEDREALFMQAMKVGKSIFRLMWDQAQEWLRAQDGKVLYVTVDDLFEAIHRSEKGRMTSKASIAWELWRRKAFKPVGEGKYLFQPKYGDLARRAETQVKATSTKTVKKGVAVQKTKSLVDIAKKTQDRQLAEKRIENRILIRYVPKAGGRTSQVHFTREIAERFFHFVLGRSRTIRLQQLRPGKAPGPIESRPLVYSTSNRNCKIEVSGARRLGEHYPTDGQRPIIVFEEIEENLFQYLPLLPSDDGFPELATHLNSLPRGRALASDITNLGTLLQIWPDYPVSE
jgi:hypothetical protein